MGSEHGMEPGSRHLAGAGSQQAPGSHKLTPGSRGLITLSLSVSENYIGTECQSRKYAKTNAPLNEIGSVGCRKGFVIKSQNAILLFLYLF